MFCCKECQLLFATEKSLHGHFRKHKLRIKEYYEKHFPKACLQTNRKLPWKSGDSLQNYLSRNFSDKTSMNQYFDSSEEPEKKRQILTDIMNDCVSRHGIIPCQAELASLPCTPTLLIYQKYFDFKDLFKDRISRFDYSINYSKPLPLQKIDPKEFMINCDTREQNRYRYYSSISGKLEVGDYCLAQRNEVVIERKSVADFGSTLVSGEERFRRELDRVKELNRYLIVLIEYDIHLLHSYRWYGYSRPELINHNMRQIIRDYSNVQFVFGINRENCIQLVVQFLLLGKEARRYDLQYWVDIRKAQFKKNEFEEEDLRRLYDNS